MLSADAGKESSSASGRPCCSLVCRCRTSIPASGVTWLLLCVSVSPCLSLSYRDTYHIGLKSQDTPIWLHSNLMTSAVALLLKIWGTGYCGPITIWSTGYWDFSISSGRKQFNTSHHLICFPIFKNQQINKEVQPRWVPREKMSQEVLRTRELWRCYLEFLYPVVLLKVYRKIPHCY